MPTFTSAYSGLIFPGAERVSGQLVRQPILDLIQWDYPHFELTDSLAASELNEYRRRYLENFLMREVGELSALEETVLTNVHERRTLTDKVEDQEPPLTRSQRWAGASAGPTTSPASAAAGPSSCFSSALSSPGFPSTPCCCAVRASTLTRSSCST